MTEENGNVNSPFSFKDCFLLPCAVVSMGAREWVTLGKFECLRGVEYVLGDVCKRNREERERKDCQLESYSFFFFQFPFRSERREGVVLRKLKLDMHVLQNDTILGTIFP
jgi:hypothetical protein